MRFPSSRETRLCHPAAMVCTRSPRVLSAFVYSHCQARINQLVMRARRRAARTLSCCLTKWITAKMMSAANPPHKRIERSSSHIGLLDAGDNGWTGGMVGSGGGVDLKIAGALLPNKRNGRLNINRISATINWEIKAI